MRRSDAYQGVDEILQADVMRFMAIIAFCLIAVLALVQAAEPAPAPTPVPEEAPADVRPAGPPEPAVTAPEPRPQPAVAPERSLSLRFASDQDFLRLVNRGDIQVFAFRQGEVLSVGIDLRFRPTPPPGRLHELLPETIPDLMTTALRDARPRDVFHWGVALPEAMARQIRAYLERGVSGELIIDRFGEVRHRGA